MLFNFTFNQTNPDAINACLEIWDEYLDQMAVLEESSLSKVKPSVAYESLLVSLFTASLKKLRLKFWYKIRRNVYNLKILVIKRWDYLIFNPKNGLYFDVGDLGLPKYLFL